MPDRKVIKNIGRLVTMEPGKGRGGRLGVIEDAALRIESGNIVWLGPQKELSGGDPDEDIIDCEGGVVLPGLIDCHTHLVHAGTRQNEFYLRSLGKTYQEIAKEGGGIMSTVRATRKASKEELCAEASARLEGILSRGVTTVEIKTGYGLALHAETKMADAIIWLSKNSPVQIFGTFLGAHIVPIEYRDRRKDYIKLVVGEMLPRVAAMGAIGACDIFVEQGAYTPNEARTVAHKAKELGMDLHLHVDQFSDGGGAALAAELCARSAGHLDYTGEEGMRAMKYKGVIPVVLPGASFFTGGGHYPDAKGMVKLGLPVAIATDYNPGTTPSLDLMLSASIAITQMGLSCDDALLGITRHAAAALGLSDRGVLALGKRADLVVFDAPDEYYLLYRYGMSFAQTVFVGGLVKYPFPL